MCKSIQRKQGIVVKNWGYFMGSLYAKNIHSLLYIIIFLTDICLYSKYDKYSTSEF